MHGQILYSEINSRVIEGMRKLKKSAKFQIIHPETREYSDNKIQISNFLEKGEIGHNYFIENGKSYRLEALELELIHFNLGKIYIIAADYFEVSINNKSVESPILISYLEYNKESSQELKLLFMSYFDDCEFLDIDKETFEDISVGERISLSRE